MKALIIDDDESLRQLFQLIFQDLGFNTAEAPNGCVAFEMIKKFEYDIIFSDMDMPLVNGEELYKLINEHSPQLINRMVFTTGNEFDEGYRRFFQEVPCPVVFKPFMVNELNDVITSVVSRSNAF